MTITLDKRTIPAVGSEATTQGEVQNGRQMTALPLESGFCLSLWLQTVRNNPLLNHRTTDELPREAEVVIIGSGVSSTICYVASRMRVLICLVLDLRVTLCIVASSRPRPSKIRCHPRSSRAMFRSHRPQRWTLQGMYVSYEALLVKSINTHT